MGMTHAATTVHLDIDLLHCLDVLAADSASGGAILRQKPPKCCFCDRVGVHVIDGLRICKPCRDEVEAA
jgi:hypothetical protein